MTKDDAPVLERVPYHGNYKFEKDEDEATLNQDPANPAAATPEPAPELNPQEKSYKDRYDSLKTHYDKTVVELRGQIKELQTNVQKKSSTDFELPDTKEQFEEWRKNYPDIYQIVRHVSRLEATEATKQLQTQVEAVEQDRKQNAREKAEVALLRLHPDWHDLRVDADFRAWLDDQDPVIQGYMYDNTDNPHLASKAISMYKAEKLLANQKKSAKPKATDASMAVGRSGTNVKTDDVNNQPKQWTLSEIDKMTPVQYERNEADIEKALKEGRVIFDR